MTLCEPKAQATVRPESSLTLPTDASVEINFAFPVTSNSIARPVSVENDTMSK
jgi:hypothetical protein